MIKEGGYSKENIIKIFGNKLGIILIIVVFLLTACRSNADIYGLKTEITNEENIKEILNTLDWKDYKFKAFEIDDNNIIVEFDGNYENFRDEDLKTLVENAIKTLVLVDKSEEVIYKYSDGEIFSMPRDFASEIVNVQFGEELDYYMDNAEKFNELESNLSGLKIKNGSIKKLNNDPYLNLDMDYIVKHRLNKQRWVYESISYDLKQIKDGNKTSEELMEYLRGVREFTHPDITEGIFGIVYKDSPEILKVFNRILGSANLSQKSLQEISEEEIDILIENYDRLEHLLSSNNNESSIIYYLENDDIDNVKFIEMLNEIDSLLDEVEERHKKN